MERVNMWMIRFRLKCAGVAALLKEEDGIGTVEMILILVVLIGLVLIFKEKLNSLVGDIFDTIKSKSGSV
jgi:Flp pilus assembly pilin Flp